MQAKSIRDIEAQRDRLKLSPLYRYSFNVDDIAKRYIRNISRTRECRQWKSELDACKFKNGSIRKSMKTFADERQELINNTKFPQCRYNIKHYEWCVSAMGKDCQIYKLFGKESEARDEYTTLLIKYPNAIVKILCRVY